MGANKVDLLGLLGAADRDSEVQHHVVMVPYPLQGHINPTMQLAKLLLSKHATMRVTFVTTKYNYDRIQSTRPSAATALSTSCCTQQQAADSRLHLVWVDNGLPPHFDYTDLASTSRLRDFHVGACNMKDPFKQLLQELNQTEAPVSCVLYGSFFPWVHTVAAEFGIPSIFFWTQSTTVFSIYYHVPLLDANGFFPYNKKAPSGCSEELANNDQLVSYIPGVPPLHPTSFPTLLHLDSTSDPSLPIVTEQFAILGNCSGVIINSFEGLEREAYQALQDKLPCPLLLIGPLIPSAFLHGGDMNDTAFGASLLEEAKECIQWLDSQEVHSVLYISVGSLFNFCTEDVDAIASAIKARKQPFLWVLRPMSSLQDLDDILPKGFMEDTKEYGLIIPWAPQVEVLSHPSLGAFLTHCGWNSTIESVSMGVPMIPFPHFSDQTTNCTLVCDIWKIGKALKRQDDGKVKHEDVEALLRALFKEEAGEEMRRRAGELREVAQRAALARASCCIYTQR